MNVETKIEDLTTLKEETIKENYIILYNDEVNTFEHVIKMLIKYCKHDELQAEQCAFIVHYKGKCSVKKGEYKMLEPIFTVLAEKGLTVEIN